MNFNFFLFFIILIDETERNKDKGWAGLLHIFENFQPKSKITL